MSRQILISRLEGILKCSGIRFQNDVSHSKVSNIFDSLKISCYLSMESISNFRNLAHTGSLDCTITVPPSLLLLGVGGRSSRTISGTTCVPAPGSPADCRLGGCRDGSSDLWRRGEDVVHCGGDLATERPIEGTRGSDRGRGSEDEPNPVRGQITIVPPTN